MLIFLQKKSYHHPPVCPGLLRVHLPLEQPHLENPGPTLLDLTPAPLTLGKLGHDVVPGGRGQLVIGALHPDEAMTNYQNVLSLGLDKLIHSLPLKSVVK